MPGSETITVDVGGAGLVSHLTRGSEPGRDPVIWLHPWFGCWQFWRRPIEGIPETDNYSVDMYSLGEVADWRRFAGPRQIAEAVLAMLDRLDIGRCTLVGNSTGGIAAQAFAATWPERVGRMLLVGTGARTTGVKPDFRKAIFDWVEGPPDRAFSARMVDSLIARRPEDPAEFETFVDMVANANKAFMGTMLSNVFALDLRPELGRVTAETLVVRGGLDRARTPEHVAEILAHIPGSRAVEIADAGHSPQVDSPEAFAAIARSFILG